MAKKRLTTEEKKQIEERKRRENEVKALFDEYDEVYGKKRYIAKVPELLKYLKYKKNAKTFWENPHIKMIYNISDRHNFLLSVYAEETDNRKYEKWLREHFSNPFFDKVIVNFEMIQNYFEISELDKQNLYYFLIDLTDSRYNYLRQNNLEYEIFERGLMDNYKKLVRKYRLMKYVPISALLDRDYYQDLIKKGSQLPLEIKEAQSSINHVNKILNNIRIQLSAEEIDFNAIINNFNLAIDSLNLTNQLFFDKDYSSPERLNLGKELSEVHSYNLYNDPAKRYTFDANDNNYDDYYTDRCKHFTELSAMLSVLNNKYTDTIETIAKQYTDKVLFLHPLIAMDNMFFRLDVYNIWKNVRKNQWSDVRKNSPDMFAILDALVKSRKNYLKEICK